MRRCWPLAAVVVLLLSPVYAQPQVTATPPPRVPDPPFNTLAAAQDLEGSGFTGDQAAALAHALAYANSRLATQDDLDRLVSEVRTSNAELRARSAEQGQTIIMWLGGIALGIAGIFVGIAGILVGVWFPRSGSREARARSVPEPQPELPGNQDGE